MTSKRKLSIGEATQQQALFWRELEGIDVTKLFEDQQDSNYGPLNVQAQPAEQSSCPICHVVFVPEQSSSDRTLHVNQCLDRADQTDPNIDRPRNVQLDIASVLMRRNLKASQSPQLPTQSPPFKAHSPMVKVLQSPTFKPGQSPSTISSRTSSNQNAEFRVLHCPFYKKIPGTRFTVDAFRYESIPNCVAYFLTHFHSDHYNGLTKSFSHGLIYCSVATANLVCVKLGVRREQVRALNLGITYLIDNVRVTLMDANHCPGAVLILFELPNGQSHLHTGDFRAHEQMLREPPLQIYVRSSPARFLFPKPIISLCKTEADEERLFKVPIQSSILSHFASFAQSDERRGKVVYDDDVGYESEKEENQAETEEIQNMQELPFSANDTSNSVPYAPKLPVSTKRRLTTMFLDTTYCRAQHSFATQADVLAFVKWKVLDALRECRNTLFVVGSYQIGKEKVILTISDTLKCRVYVDANKRKILSCLQDPRLNETLTNDPHATNLHVRAMNGVTVASLKQYIARYPSKWTEVMAFRPTGWTHSSKVSSLQQITPTVSGSIKVYGVPYSEHSSFEELRAFVASLRPYRVIPTVNVGSVKYREEMHQYFAEWLQ